MTPPAARGAPAHDVAMVVLVHGHRCFAEALAAVMVRRGLSRGVRVAGSVDQASAMVERDPGDPVILYDDHAGSSDVARLRRLTAARSPVPLVVLDPSDSVDDAVEALSAGASAWLEQHADLDRLRDALRSVQQGHLYLSPHMLTGVLPVLLSARPRDYDLVDPTSSSLTPREIEVLRCLVAGMGRQEIANRLFLSVHTVRSHIQKAMRKTDQHSAAALIALARRSGVRPIEELVT